MRLLVYTILLVFFWNCASVNDMYRKQATSAILQQQMWKIDNDWALPLATTSTNLIYNAGLIPPGSTVNRINLIGNPNYLKKIGDSLSIYLPFFGDRRLGGIYNTGNSAIVFDGIPKEFKVLKTRKDELKKYRVDFKNGTESYRASITIYTNGATELIINGSHRTSMRYTGHIDKLEQNEVL